MENQIPSFKNLYSRDLTLKSTISLTFAPLAFNALTYIMEGGPILFLPYILYGLSAIGLISFILRYIQVTSTFRDGITIKGKVIDTPQFTSRRKNGGRRKSYYAVCEYTAGNEKRNAQIRLPGMPEFYGISKGNDIDLILKEENPKTVFIKHIFLD